MPYLKRGEGVLIQFRGLGCALDCPTRYEASGLREHPPLRRVSGSPPSQQAVNETMWTADVTDMMTRSLRALLSLMSLGLAKGIPSGTPPRQLQIRFMRLSSSSAGHKR